MHYIKNYGALIIEAFKIFPDVMENNAEVKFGGDFKMKSQFGSDQNINHTMLILGAILTGYDLLCSMGVKSLLAIESGLAYEAHPHNVHTNALVTQSGSPRNALKFDDNDNNGIEAVAEDVLEDYRWGINNESWNSKKCEEESVVKAAAAKMPSYWMTVDPKKIAYITT
eukprot:scaffold107003_cov40-Attheya_sp.AAC.3